MKSIHFLAVLAALCYSSSAQNGPNYVVVVPNVVQPGVEQKATVSIFNLDDIQVNFQVLKQDGSVLCNPPAQLISQGEPKDFAFLIPLDQVPSPDDNGNRFVNVRVFSNDPRLTFDKRVRVVLDSKFYSVFVQTDKPIYIRDDVVHTRFAFVRYDLLPLDSATTVIVDLKNPQDVVVNRFQINVNETTTIKKKDIRLGPSPVTGIWTIRVKHGLDNELVKDYFFEVKDYVLPRFGVTIDAPSYVSLADQTISVGIEAKYTYGKDVNGLVSFRLGVWNEDTQKAVIFHRTSSNLVGSVVFEVPNDNWPEGFPEGKRLYVLAEVKEKSSGITQNKSDISACFSNTPVTLDCQLTPPFYKPNLPFRLLVRAQYCNGRPASVNIDGTLQGSNKKLTGKSDPKEGLVDFPVDVGSSTGRISLTLNVRKQRVSEICRFEPFISPNCNGATNSIVVRPKQQRTFQTEVHSEFELVKADNNIISVFGFVKSCGVLQKQFQFRTEDGPITTFQITFGSETCRKATVVVTHINTCNQDVADSVSVDVEQRCPNDVSLEIDNSQTHLPGADVELTINAAAQSEIALLAVDRGLYLLNSKNKLSKEQIFDEQLTNDRNCRYTTRNSKGILNAAGLTGFGKNYYLPTRQSLDCPARRRREVRSTSDLRCLSEFCEFGKRVARQGKPESVLEKCNRGSRELYEGVIKISSDCELTDGGLSKFKDCCISLYARSQDANLVPEEIDDKLIQTRSFFPHVWLWDQEYNTGDKTKLTKTITLPDSITEWEIQALAFSKEKGFCVAKPVSVRAFKSVFVECHVPFSFRRQEQVSLKCTAYNYRNSILAVGMQIKNPSDGLCTSAGPGRSTHLERFRVPALNTITHTFPFVPLNIGEPNITVSLISSEGEDHLVQKLRVVPEGELDEYDYSAELDPQGIHVERGPKCSFAAAGLDFRQGTCYRTVTNNATANQPICGSPLLGTFTKTACCDAQLPKSSVAWSEDDGQTCELCPTKAEHFVCNVQGVPGGLKQKNIFYTRLPENHVPGSVTAWISCTGKYFEGTITVIDGIGSLLRQPGGCGEQSMLRFGPNAAIAKYYFSTGQLVGAKLDQVVDLLERGLAYQMKYRKPNGAFTVWTHHEASTWLSSFVLQTICQAKSFIYVDPNIITSLSNFLVNSRQNADGSFYEPKRVYHREMIGGVQESDSSLTSFVILSLLECCDTAPAEAICNGVGFLKSQYDANRINRPYARAIAYSALLRACRTCKKCECDPNLLRRARELLDKNAVINEDGSKHWPVGDALGEAYWYQRRPEAISVETTAYALCAYVEAGDAASAGSIAKWLNSVRNSKGAFASTQDTVVALKCLALYAESLKQERSINVKVSAHHDKAFGVNFDITKYNRDVNHRVEVPVNDIIKVETTGTGLGICQLHVQYNIPKALEDRCRFEFTVEAEKFKNEEKQLEEDDKYIVVSVCAKYLGENETSMAMVEVDLPTGYEACERGSDDCLEELQRDHGRNLGLSSIDVLGTGPAFYFDTIPTGEPLCFAFRANKKYDVKHLVPVSARVYDYYEPDEKCTKFYTVDGTDEKLSVLCKDRKHANSPLCVCGGARCPTSFDQVKNRVCQVHCHRDYAYKLRVVKIDDSGEWQEVTCHIEKVLKQGNRKDIEDGSEIIATMPQICGGKKILEEGKVYHVQGKDGAKFVFDDSALIEKWPKSVEECLAEVDSKCDPPTKHFKKPCDEINNAKKKSSCVRERKICTKKRRKDCEKKGDKEFECYLKKIGEFQRCSLSDVCVKDICAKH